MLLIPGLRCLCGVSETPITDPLATPTVIKDSCEVNPRGFNGFVNITESCDFQSQFDPLNIICKPCFFFILFCRHMHFE